MQSLRKAPNDISDPYILGSGLCAKGLRGVMNRAIKMGEKPVQSTGFHGLDGVQTGL